MGLETLLEGLRAEAEAEAAAIRERAEQEAAALREATAAERADRQERSLANRREELADRMRRRLADREQQLRAALLEARYDLVEVVLDAAEDRLDEVIDDPRYPDALAADLDEALSYAGRQPIRIVCGPESHTVFKDLPLIEAALQATANSGAEEHLVSFDVRPGMGPGFLLVTIDGRLEVDGTSAGRLEFHRSRHGRMVLDIAERYVAGIDNQGADSSAGRRTDRWTQQSTDSSDSSQESSPAAERGRS